MITTEHGHATEDGHTIELCYVVRQKDGEILGIYRDLGAAKKKFSQLDAAVTRYNQTNKIIDDIRRETLKK